MVVVLRIAVIFMNALLPHPGANDPFAAALGTTLKVSSSKVAAHEPRQRAVLSARGEEQVCRLEVAMDDTCGLELYQNLANLATWRLNQHKQTNTICSLVLF